MSLQAMVCPKCNGQIYFEKDQESCFCSHCGTQVFHNDKQSFTYRTIDDAKVKEQEVKHDIAIKQLNYRERKEKKLFWRDWIVLGIGWGFIILAVILLVVFNTISDKKFQKTEAEMAALGKISAGSSSNYRNENYKSALAILETAGFTNIELVELNDTSENDGIVDTIAIGGKSSFDRENFWDPDVKIIITYH